MSKTMSGAQEKHKIHLVSLGCPKNTVDSERMLGLLGGNDYGLTTDPHEADVVIVNTCGFIGPAKEESINAILAAQKSGSLGGIVAADVRLHFARWPRDWQAGAAWLAERQEGGYVREVFSHFAYLIQRLLGPAFLDETDNPID